MSKQAIFIFVSLFSLSLVAQHAGPNSPRQINDDVPEIEQHPITTVDVSSFADVLNRARRVQEAQGLKINTIIKLFERGTHAPMLYCDFAEKKWSSPRKELLALLKREKDRGNFALGAIRKAEMKGDYAALIDDFPQLSGEASEKAYADFAFKHLPGDEAWAAVEDLAHYYKKRSQTTSPESDKSLAKLLHGFYQQLLNEQPPTEAQLKETASLERSPEGLPLPVVRAIRLFEPTERLCRSFQYHYFEEMLDVEFLPHFQHGDWVLPGKLLETFEVLKDVGETRDFLFNGFKNSANVRVRDNYARLLRRTGLYKEYKDHVLDLTHDPETDVRRPALEIIERGSPRFNSQVKPIFWKELNDMTLKESRRERAFEAWATATGYLREEQRLTIMKDLLRLLKQDTSPNIRNSVMQLYLKDINLPDKALKMLLNIAKTDESASNRLMAIQTIDSAIKRFEDDRAQRNSVIATQYLLPAVEAGVDDKSAEVRNTAFYEADGVPLSDELFSKALTAFVNDPSETVQETAGELVVGTKDPKRVMLIKDAIGTPEIRHNIAEKALKKFISRMNFINSYHQYPDLLADILATDPYSAVREEAADTLGELPGTPEIFDTLLFALDNDEDRDVRRAASKALAKQPGARPLVAQRLLKAFNAATEFKHKLTFARDLAQYRDLDIDTKPVISELMGYIGNDQQQTFRAIDTLKSFKTHAHEAAQSFWPAASDPQNNIHLRQLAMNSINIVAPESEEFFPKLLELAKNSDLDDLSKNTAMAGYGIVQFAQTSPKMVNYLVEEREKALAEDDTHTVTLINGLLKRTELEFPEINEMNRRGLLESSPQTRLYLANRFARQRIEEALPELKQALEKETDPEIREALEKAIHETTHPTGPPHPPKTEGGAGFGW